MKLLLRYLFLVSLCANTVNAQQIVTLKGQPFQNVTLEASLKPFKKNDKAYIRAVAQEMFTQWQSLLRHADTVSVMLWTSDGSEILEYTGRPNQQLEWARYMGNPNTEHPVGSGPDSLSLHERAYYYMDKPPVFSYADLKFIIQTLKETGQRITGKVIRIGATFDPGPEFAHADFKYKNHPEVLGGNAMGKKSFVSCYSVLKADKTVYAGFPQGIPGNTPFGVFFGRQCRHFLTDMGYDFIWFSNGMGYGMEAWSSSGALFDGKTFNAGKLPEIRSKILEFWQLFRKECPQFQIQTRGTNLSTGVDLARDGVDLKDIYSGGFNIMPPPNSPWAALDGDYGMELVGYMSRIAEVPDNRYLFRYYVHDPWWVNSPWFDRYGGEPHDIYLPMSVSRINEKGQVSLPAYLNILTIDNSYGDMPVQAADEVIPHILRARYEAPTAPGPLVWVYPFEEYHQWAGSPDNRLPEIYFGDWFMRQAINEGLPLNTIISTNAFRQVIKQQPGFFQQSVLMSVVPTAGSPLEKALISFVESGGKLIVYGPADHAGPAFAKLLNLDNTHPLNGVFSLNIHFKNDSLEQRHYPDSILHKALFSGGGVSTIISNKTDAGTKALVAMTQAGDQRDVVWSRSAPAWNGGKVVYVRGTNSSSFKGSKLLTPDDPEQWFTGPLLLRYAIQEFGYRLLLQKQRPGIKSPVLTISRSNNAFYFSGFTPNTTVRQFFKFPEGAPVFTGYETALQDGSATYSFPPAWHRECRVFITQQEGIVSCRETYSGDRDIRRRIKISGLQHATVRIFPDSNITASQLRAYINSAYPWKTGKVSVKKGDARFGNNYVVENVNGELAIAW